jgi:outer membrane protein OmpA-like peptidoglycan-associated protein
LKLLQDNPALKVQIGGHTDSKGSNEYNKILSERRSRSVVNWLVGKGISKSRLSARGYGEEVPLASNDDEEEGRELNRRTEFEVTSN